jgi:hypothetical protein
MRPLRWILPLLLLAGFTLGLRTAEAQQTSAIDRLVVALWPEYDQPAMLVILRAQLPPDTALPAEITLPIPAEVGEPLAVAYSTSEGALVNAPYTRQAQGDWALITLTSESRSAQVEYYQPLTLSGNERSFSYTWPGGQDLAGLGYEVQHPVGAQAMAIDPPPQSTAPRPDGLLYSFGELGPVPGTETRLIDLRYERDSSTLSVDSATQTSPPVAGPAEPAEGGMDVTTWLPFGLGAIGGVLVLVGGALYWRSRRRSSGVAVRARHRGRRSAQPESAPALDASAVFCHSCGTQAAVTDKFCRQCGTKLRS